jgi:hypothetical protein
MIKAMAVIPRTAVASAHRVQAGGGGISKPETITALVSAAASRSGIGSGRERGFDLLERIPLGLLVDRELVEG